MCEVAGHFVFKSELLFLETVEKVFVRVGSMLFLLDEGVKSGMLRFEFLGHSLVHWCSSFRSACHRCVINHETPAESWGFSRFGRLAALLAVNSNEVPAGAGMG